MTVTVAVTQNVNLVVTTKSGSVLLKIGHGGKDHILFNAGNGLGNSRTFVGAREPCGCPPVLARNGAFPRQVQVESC
eukprot:1688682-Amphidinium_carterae.1